MVRKNLHKKDGYCKRSWEDIKITFFFMFGHEKKKEQEIEQNCTYMTLSIIF